MSKRLIFLALILSINSFSQEMITKSGQQHKATPEWDFICNNYVYSGILKVQIAKTEKGGLLRLAIDVANNEMFISGTVYLYLDDFTIVACTDKNNREIAGKTAVSYYNFTIPEMNRLKKTAIKDIRFTIKGKESSFSNRIGNFTATNKKKYFEGSDKTIRNSFETEKEIQSLFQ
jgi:hypothetical protein